MRNLFLMATASEVWENINNFITKPVVSIVVRVLLAILVLSIGFKLAKYIAKRYESSKGAARLNKTVRNFLKNVIAIVLYAMVIIGALLVLGFELSVFSAAIASIGVTIACDII